MDYIPENIKLEENIGEKLHSLGVGNDLVDVRSKAQATKAKRDKLDYVNL